MGCRAGRCPAVQTQVCTREPQTSPALQIPEDMHGWGNDVPERATGISRPAAQSPATCTAGAGACSLTSSSLLSIRALIGLMPEPVAKMKQVGNCFAGARSGRNPLPITAVTSTFVPAAQKGTGSLLGQEVWKAAVNSHQPAPPPPACWGNCLGIAAWLARSEPPEWARPRSVMGLVAGGAVGAPNQHPNLTMQNFAGLVRSVATCSFPCNACRIKTAPL